MKNIKLAAIAYSKHRNIFGLVGVEILVKQKKIRVALAREWTREQINQMTPEIGELFRQMKWGDTYIDQLTGQSIITKLRSKEKMYLKIINTQKNVKNPDPIEQAIIMDMIDMAQYMIQIKINHQLEFPPKPTEFMLELEKQIGIFSEVKSERGGLDYLALGAGHDNLTRALIICCFAARKYIDGNPLKFISESEVELDTISILNKEVEEGRTGLNWQEIK